MTLKDKIEKLAGEINAPCITISFNTHRTHPDNLKDEIVLKNLVREAEERVIVEYGKRAVKPLLKKLETITEEINRDYLLDSLHIFLSNDTKEIIKLSVQTRDDVVYMDDTFHVNPLIKAYNRTDEYLILLLSQGGVNLYKALNDHIEEEIKNDDFPFDETPYYVPDDKKKSDPKYVDDMVREYFNEVDKALVKIYNQLGLKTVVICTEDNYSRLMQVADKPGMYLGYEAIDYNNTAVHHLAAQAWKMIQELQRKERTEAIAEIKEAAGQKLVITDLQEIYQAAVDGRGDLLIACEDFSQPVVMKDARTFEAVDDPALENAVDDITGTIAWEVISKGGRVVFTKQEQLLDLGNIVLKTRY